MKISLHELTSNRATLDEDLQAYRVAGWTAFEIAVGKANAYIREHGIAGFVSLVKGSGLKPVAFSGHSVKAFSTPEEIEANELEFRRILDIMTSVACPVVIFGGDGPSDIPRPTDIREESLATRDRCYREHLSHFADQVAKLADLAKPNGVSMALEINWCTLCRSLATAAEVIEMVSRENVGLVFDTAHFACSESRLSDLDLLKGHIIAGHLNDLRNSPPEVRDHNGDRLIPGEGILPLIEWLEKVEDCGYDGWHSVEIFSEDLWAESPLEIARKVMAGCKRLWPDTEF